MSQEFNKQLMLDNIAFMLKELGKKIGEFENEAGVSPGYISRTSKEESKKPAVDFVVKAADALGISVSTLLTVDLSALSPTERYLIGFLEKLTHDTKESKLEWECQTKDYLCNMSCDVNCYVEHPLFSYETFMEKTECEYPEEVSRVVFVSHSFGCNTYTCGPGYVLRLKNGTYLYIMDISKNVHRTNDTEAYAREVWIYKSDVGKQFLCSNKDKSYLGSLVNSLYETIKEYSYHPKVKKGLKEAIDAFLIDDLEDDKPNNSDNDWPF